jgi:acyl-coenzyme A thioesterase PaaI-like protein
VPGNFRFSTTVSLTTSFLRGAKSGILTAAGRIEGMSGRLVTGTGEVRDDTGNLCAVAQASFLYFPGSERPEGVPRR